MFPALITFFMGVQNTPGLREILWDVTELPSVWSVLKHGGKVNPGFNIEEDIAAVEPGAWTMPDRSLYRMGIALSLNEQPALRISLTVTSPLPPLLTTAGIVGIVAQPPGKKDKRMDLRVVAAHRAHSVISSVAEVPSKKAAR